MLRIILKNDNDNDNDKMVYIHVLNLFGSLIFCMPIFFFGQIGNIVYNYSFKTYFMCLTQAFLFVYIEKCEHSLC